MSQSFNMSKRSLLVFPRWIHTIRCVGRWSFIIISKNLHNFAHTSNTKHNYAVILFELCTEKAPAEFCCCEVLLPLLF